MMERLKKNLKEQVDGKVMVRKAKYGATEYFKVYFDIPTPTNKAIIKTLINLNGYKVWNEDCQVVGGTYGYVYNFQ